jgi:hypothetical protein
MFASNAGAVEIRAPKVFNFGVAIKWQGIFHGYRRLA